MTRGCLSQGLNIQETLVSDYPAHYGLALNVKATASLTTIC